MPVCFALMFLFAQAPQRPVATVREQVARVHALMRGGKTSEAFKEIREMLDSHPGDPEAQFEAGEVLQELAGLTFKRIEHLSTCSVETHELPRKYSAAQ